MLLLLPWQALLLGHAATAAAGRAVPPCQLVLDVTCQAAPLGQRPARLKVLCVIFLRHLFDDVRSPLVLARGEAGDAPTAAAGNRSADGGELVTAVGSLVDDGGGIATPRIALLLESLFADGALAAERPPRGCGRCLLPLRRSRCLARRRRSRSRRLAAEAAGSRGGGERGRGGQRRGLCLPPLRS